MELTNEFWDLYMQLYALWMPHFGPHRELLVEVLLRAGVTDGVVLDAGCGPGLLVERLLSFPKFNGLVYGVDISPAALKVACERIGSDRVQKWIEGGLDDISFESLPTFDAVYSVNSLYALRDPLAFLRRVSCRLNTGGVIACVTICNPDTRLLDQAFESWLRERATDAERAELERLEWATKSMRFFNGLIAEASAGRSVHVLQSQQIVKVFNDVGLRVEYAADDAYGGTAAFVVARN